MKFPKPITIVVCLLLLSWQVSARQMPRYSTVKIYPPEDKHQRDELFGLLEIDHFMPRDGGVIVEISERNIEDLKKTGYKYEIIVPDTKKALEEENARFYAARAAGRVALEQTGQGIDAIIPTPLDFQVWGSNGGYYRYAQMIDVMDDLVATYPSLCQKVALPIQSYQGRTIWALKISDNVSSDEAEPEILYMGLQHAREAIGGSSMIFLMQYLCEQYATNARIQELVNNREFYIIPCFNPDGWEYNLDNGAGSGWRKNRRGNGVDLNRNYSVDWGTCGTVTCGSSTQCGSSTSTQETYYGSSAFSEPETQAMRAFVTSRNFVAAIDQHAFGPYYSLPYGKTARTLNAEEANIFTYIPAAMAQYNGMRAGNSCQSVGYEVAGGIKDWWLVGDIGTGTKGKIIGMTGEGGAGGGTGGTYGSFWPPASKIIALCKGMIYQDLQLAYAAGSYVDIQDVDDVVMTVKTNGTLTYKLTRIGLANQAVNVSIIPLENMMTVGPTAVVSTSAMPNYHDTYQGTISYSLFPGVTNGQRVRFVWRVQTGGITFYDTVTKIYHTSLTPLVNENMDAGTIGSKWTAGTGWVYTTAGTGMGGGTSKALSESAAGTNYAAGVTTPRYVTLIAPINTAGATATYMSFWIRHLSENFRDKLQVQISPNNGTNWYPVVATSTVQEPNMGDGETLGGQPAFTGIRPDWTRQLVDLSAYNGNTQVRLRFAFTSDAHDGTDAFYMQEADGFFIDNIKIVSTNATLVNLLPVNFTSITGKLLNDNTIRVEWEATTDAQHDYFEIEKSYDGINFYSIGEERGGAPYKFIDKEPYAGNNYYRIKQHDLDGKINYSKTINVINNHKVSLTVYPNPVTQGEALTIRVDEGGTDVLTITVSDVQGRVVHSQIVKELPVTREIRINTDSWMKQMYLLKVQSSTGELITVQKVMKQ